MNTLSVSLGRYPHFEPLLSDTITLPSGVGLTTVEGGTGEAFQPMMRHLRYDVCELPVVNYMAARELGLPVTALPIFATRRFVQWMVEVPEHSSIHEPGDLEGKRIVSKYFGNTDCVWVRGVLREDYGVDWSNMTWVSTQTESVAGASTPDNVEIIDGADVDDLLTRGIADAKLVGGYGGPPAPGKRFLWPDPELAAAEWYAHAGVFPVLHTVIVKNDVLGSHPEIAREIYDAFVAAKETSLLAAERGDLPKDRRAKAFQSGFPAHHLGGPRRDYLGHDPLAYGFEANVAVVTRLIGFAHSQQALRNSASPEQLFLSLD